MRRNVTQTPREAVQKDIMDWILQTVTTRIQWMLWLNGAAGAGKSAIARSIVALCLARNIPIARFFFFRTDPTRNTLRPVVATLVYQLIQQLPHPPENCLLENQIRSPCLQTVTRNTAPIPRV